MKTIKTIAAFFALSLFFAFAAAIVHDHYKDLAAAQRSDFEVAFQELSPLAEQGNAAAQYNLGSLYYRDQGVEKDYAEAAKWYRKAAEQGNADAQYRLGDMYLFGRFFPKDFKIATEWYLKAYKQGHAGARDALDEMYNREYEDDIDDDASLFGRWGRGS